MINIYDFLQGRNGQKKYVPLATLKCVCYLAIMCVSSKHRLCFYLKHNWQNLFIHVSINLLSRTNYWITDYGMFIPSKCSTQNQFYLKNIASESCTSSVCKFKLRAWAKKSSTIHSSTELFSYRLYNNYL